MFYKLKKVTRKFLKIIKLFPYFISRRTNLKLNCRLKKLLTPFDIFHRVVRYFSLFKHFHPSQAFSVLLKKRFKQISTFNRTESLAFTNLTRNILKPCSRFSNEVFSVAASSEKVHNS